MPRLPSCCADVGQKDKYLHPRGGAGGPQAAAQQNKDFAAASTWQSVTAICIASCLYAGAALVLWPLFTKYIYDLPAPDWLFLPHLPINGGDFLAYDLCIGAVVLAAQKLSGGLQFVGVCMLLLAAGAVLLLLHLVHARLSESIVFDRTGPEAADNNRKPSSANNNCNAMVTT